MKLSTERKVGLGFGTGLIILFVVSAVSYYAMYELVRAAELRHHVDNVIAGLKGVLSDLDHAESEQRGYIVTGEKTYLRPFQSAVDGVAERVTGLRRLADGDARVQRQIDDLQPLIDQRVARLSQGIALRRQSGFEAAVDSVRTGVGRRLMNDIHRAIGEMSSEQTSLLRQREAAVRQQTKWTVFAIVLGSLLSLAVVFLSIIALRRELTARQKAEESLRASEERFRALVQHSNDIVSVVDAAGTLQYVSPSAESVVGHRPIEMTGRNVLEYVHPDDIGAVRDGLIAALDRPGAAPRAEYRHRRADGSWAYVEARGGSLLEAPGIRGHLLTMRDIGDRKALEQQRADFLAMLTHDIKNPLSVIMGYIELVRGKALLRGEGSRDIIENMDSSADTILSLVTDYLDVSKIEAGQMTLSKTALAVNGLLREVAERHRLEAARRGVDVELYLEEALPPLAADPLALDRVFSNLLHNALKFTPDGGQVEVRSRHDDGALVVSVSDTGPGITAEELAQLFQRYRQTDSGRAKHGTGLGLFIVKSLVEAHGGRVDVASTVGRGTRFEVRLPIGPGTQQTG